MQVDRECVTMLLINHARAVSGRSVEAMVLSSDQDLLQSAIFDLEAKLCVIAGKFGRPKTLAVLNELAAANPGLELNSTRRLFDL